MHYRQIYEKEYGKLNKGLEIHHIDGNRKNNLLSNLQALTIEEHLQIHLDQHDWGAVQAILMRIKNPNLNISDIARKTQNKLLNEQKHNFQKIDRKFISKRTMRDRLNAGNPAFLGILNPIENGRNAGLIAAKNKAGFLNINSKNHGSNFVKNTKWWTNKEGKRKRSNDCPGEDWREGMKYE